MLKIESGLFSGVVIPDSQVVTLTDDNNLPVFKSDGSLIQYWPAMYRTPLFIEKFSPIDGWGVTIETSDSQFQFPSRFPSRDGSTVFQPTLFITAKLMKGGEVMAQATSLATVEGSKSLEAAESIVRGRLYDALGLSFPRYEEPARIAQNTATEVVKPVPSSKKNVTQIKPTESSNDTQEVKAELPQSPATSSEVVVVETKTESPKADKVNGNIERNLLQQVIIQCNQKGVDVPSFESNQDAKTFLMSLLKKQA